MLTTNISVDWEPYPWQAEVMGGLRLNSVILCARQMGKTTLLLRILLDYACRRPNGCYWYVSPTIDLGRRQYRTFKNLLIGTQVFRFNDTERIITCPNGAIIEFKSFEQGDALRGPSVHGLVIDEVGTMTKAFVSDVLEPTTTHTGGWIIYCGTPPDPLEVPDPSFFEDLAKYARLTHDEDWAHFSFDFHAVADLEVRGATYRAKVRKYRERHSEDSYGWRREYLVQFVRTEEISLPWEHLRWYASHEYLPAPLETIITVDPSFSDKEAADPRAIVTSGLCPDGDLYIMRAEQGRWGYEEFITRIYRAYREAKEDGWNPQQVGIEKAGVGLPFIKALHREGEQRKEFLPIHEIPNYGSTLSRIMSLEPWLQGKRIVLCEASDGCREMSNQMELFPRGLLNPSRRASSMPHHFDVLNALAFRTQNFYPPPRPVPEFEDQKVPPGHYSFRDEWDSAIKGPAKQPWLLHTG